MEKEKPSRETFLKALANVPICDEEESKEILKALNNMSEEDKEIVRVDMVKLEE